jgi:acyl-CoA reductase-like NAD-dependent aldehyde dehydrogenase
MITQLAVSDVIRKQREFFKTGRSKDITFRIEQLKTLKKAIIEHQPVIINALKADLNKPEFEAYATELWVVKEIDYAIKHIKSWTLPKKAPIGIEQFPGLWAYLCRTPWGYLDHWNLELPVSADNHTLGRCDRSRELCDSQTFRNCSSYIFCCS